MRLTNVATASRPRMLPTLVFTCLVLLAGLTVAVVMGLNPPGDTALVTWALGTRNAALTTVLQVFTFLGSAAPALAVCIALSGIELARLLRQSPARRVAWGVLVRASWPVVAYAGMLVCNTVMRTLIARQPPDVDSIPNLLPEIQTEFQRFSFPSGHAGAILVAYGALAVVAWRAPALRRFVPAAVAALVLGVGFGRVYLGVHWPSDVAAGYLLGLIWLSVAVALCQRRQPDSGT